MNCTNEKPNVKCACSHKVSEIDFFSQKRVFKSTVKSLQNEHEKEKNWDFNIFFYKNVLWFFWVFFFLFKFRFLPKSNNMLLIFSFSFENFRGRQQRKFTLY